jgi:sulfite reductase (NADPH) hemoprotein beta-component
LLLRLVDGSIPLAQNATPGIAFSEAMSEPSAVERIKERSNYLRGTIAAGLADEATGAIAEDDTQLTKFHGVYQQDDRDLRNERARQKLEPAFSFMARVRVPGGVVTSRQWLALDELARTHANGTLRLTTRQSFQFHGIIKRDLKETIAGINQALLDTLAACGDVNRNDMCSPLPEQSAVHREAYAWARHISDHLTPHTSAYHEIWLDGEKVGGAADEEPIYGKTYLPRKFKMAVVVPPVNDVDVFAQDLGFIALARDGRLEGFNVVVGGGLGMSHGEPATYPRLADVIGRCAPEQAIAVSEHVVGVQRDYGDRTNRKHARLKYTIADLGLEWFKDELEHRLGFALAPAEPVEFATHGDRYGWIRGDDGRWHLTLFVENGRLADFPARPLLTGLRRIAAVHDGELRLTPNQNVIVSGVAPEKRPAIDALLASHGLTNGTGVSELRRNAMACVALPSCGLAMAEAERYLPDLITRLEGLAARHGLADEPIVVRMTGCPNGCARPYLAEIGLVGKAPGRYNLYLGADFAGRRHHRLYRENADEPEILSSLEPIFARYAGERLAQERFGDFVVRAGYV